MPVRVDVLGMRFGRLVATECIGPEKASIKWLFLCDCGKQKIATASNVRSGKTQSCGCLHREVSSLQAKISHPLAVAANTTHGHSAIRNTKFRKEYNIWLTMRQRCRNPRTKKFEDYGGRGITVCARWDSFENFIADMGPKTEGLSLDRINNDGNYEPSNCRWATRTEQANNQRYRKDSHWIEFDGERRTITEWAKVRGIKPVTLYARITRYKWPIERALAA